MRYAIVAFHHPKPEHADELVERMTRAAEVMAGVAGCVDVGCWREDGGDAVVSTGTFESREAWLAALEAVTAAGIDIEFDDREARPRDVHTLVSV